MYGRYLRRELAGRRKQTVIVAVGLGVAIALVMIVNALTAGVRDAQAEALESVYGVGTDLTVTGASVEPGEGGGGQRFDFDAEAGESTDDDSTTLSSSMLSADMMRSTIAAATLDDVLETDGVSAATAALSLTNSTFSGEVPTGGFGDQGDGAEEGGMPSGDQQPPQGGADGAGGSSFGVDSFSVLGIDPAGSEIGPLASVEVSDGRALDADDAGALVALVDASYASTNEIAVGDVIDVAGSDIEVVGIVASTSDEADTAANVYLPLDTAQTLAGLDDVVSTIYVQAGSASDIDAVQASLESALPDAEVNSQSDLASTVSGALTGATSMITSLGTWLSIIVLVVALLLAVLFTISGVSRRTREFGTLKAIGWSDGRVVRQVAGESMVQGLIGGIVGLVIGTIGIIVIEIVQPTVSSTAATTAGEGMGGMGGPLGGGMEQAQAASEIVLHAPFTPAVVLAAVGIAVLGGLLAGMFGGWRAARLSPAEALRSVA